MANNDSQNLHYQKEFDLNKEPEKKPIEPAPPYDPNKDPERPAPFTNPLYS